MLSRIQAFGMTNQKYRPYFTSSELSELISSLKENPKPSRIPLIRYLEGFALKIERGLITSAHTLEPTIEQKLELEISHTEAVNSIQSKRFNAYRKWREFAHKCTPDEIEQAQTYRYENDLMSEEEEKEYDKLFTLNMKGI
jgi:hypothetical protein